MTEGFHKLPQQVVGGCLFFNNRAIRTGHGCCIEKSNRRLFNAPLKSQKDHNDGSHAAIKHTISRKTCFW